MILNSQKHVFWEALILAVFVFTFGVIMGYLMESSRADDIQKLYTQSELDMNDAKIQGDIVSLDKLSCSVVIQETINFADRIYWEAMVLERYDNANRISSSIKIEHKRYDLLRTMLWVNFMQIKQRCNSSFHTVVYLYDYNEPKLDVRAKQNVFSRLLGEIKSDKGNDVVLIPIAGDNNVASLGLLMNNFGISESGLPVILIDEKVKIAQVESKEEIEKYLN